MAKSFAWVCFASGRFAAAGVSAPPAKDTWTGVDRIVALGDVHGDYEQFVKLLRSAGLIDDNEDWAGGRTHLVQTGDVPDRRADSGKVMDLLMKLEKRAKGYVHALTGNHETMNMHSAPRYVHPREYCAFKSPQSTGTRRKYYQQHVHDVKLNPPPEGSPSTASGETNRDGSHGHRGRRHAPA